MQEGEDNDNFTDIHPQNAWSRKAFWTLHRLTYRIFHLCVCILILLLALIEEPSLASHTDLPEGTLTAIVVVSPLLLSLCKFQLCLIYVYKILWRVLHVISSLPHTSVYLRILSLALQHGCRFCVHHSIARISQTPALLFYTLVLCCKDLINK